ncbi:MAG TPA: GntR family transcriptional regulator [Halanaerobiales bacterium]|nr:GntR family transcriptional regulator [Halanaerobiales bacterium]
MTIQKDAPESFYEQIKQRIFKRVNSGEYRAEEKIPSERELCKHYSVSRTTIRKAIDELVAEGVLIRRSGRGTFVADNLPKVKKKTDNILFLRCVHSDISRSTSEIKDDIFYPKVLAGVEIAASKNNYHCLYKIINENDFNEEELEKSINNSDGIVCAEVHNYSFLKHLRKFSESVVLVCSSINDAEFDMVEIDNLKGSIEAVNYLIDNGHRDIAFIGGSEKSCASTEREEGYLQTLKKRGKKINPSFILSYGWRLEDGYNAVMDLLKQNTLPTAIFAASDLLAIGAINAIKDSGYSIPEDISVIGFDDIEMAGQVKPSLTTMRVRRAEMGEIAAKLMFERVNSQRDYPVRIAVPTVLQKRNSVKEVVEK